LQGHYHGVAVGDEYPSDSSVAGAGAAQVLKHILNGTDIELLGLVHSAETAGVARAAYGGLNYE
jgi:hypothetical protein